MNGETNTKHNTVLPSQIIKAQIEIDIIKNFDEVIQGNKNMHTEEIRGQSGCDFLQNLSKLYSKKDNIGVKFDWFDNTCHLLLERKKV